MQKFKELQELVNEILNPELMTDMDVLKDAVGKNGYERYYGCNGKSFI